jgi:hypothetical protein
MGVEFNEGQIPNYNYQPKKAGIAQLIIKLGLAKDEAGAQKIMIVITILCFALSFYFFYKALN